MVGRKAEHTLLKSQPSCENEGGVSGQQIVTERVPGRVGRVGIFLTPVVHGQRG